VDGLPIRHANLEEMLPMAGSRSASRRAQALIAAIVLLTAVPASAVGAEPGHPNPSNEMVRVLVAGGDTVALINSGQMFDGETFEGIPDGIGLVPVAGRRAERVAPGGPRGLQYLDLYVNFEQSHVPFQGFADFEDSSVQRARLNLETMRITQLEEVLPASAGFIRFCSSFMAGPEHGFDHYTLLLGEESNDQLLVPAGAPYETDPSLPADATFPARRQAGLTAYLDTRNGKFDALEGHGRHNHENNVVVPGGWINQIVSLSTDDTFITTSTAARPNLSQLYLHSTLDQETFLAGQGTLYGFRVTGTDAGAVNRTDPFNGANDYFDIDVGDDWTGEFIPVPEDIANGDTASLPQDALEDWSNTNNVFQFIRLEDVAYDPDDPRTVYVADTGNTRLYQDPTTGRLRRLISATDPLVPQSKSTNGRLFKFVMNESDPLVVDSFSVVADGGAPAVPGGSAAIPPPAGHPAWRAPDNLDVSHSSIMVQEDATDAKIWMHSLATGVWTHVAQVDQDQNPATTGDPGESSGIVDASTWLGAGWWVLDVQSHNNQTVTTGAPFVWNEPPGPPIGTQYQKRRENGQLLLMFIPGS
jgi:hypothetical protein